jgi:hypothetical protein
MPTRKTLAKLFASTRGWGPVGVEGIVEATGTKVGKDDDPLFIENFERIRGGKIPVPPALYNRVSRTPDDWFSKVYPDHWMGPALYKVERIYPETKDPPLLKSFTPRMYCPE